MSWPASPAWLLEQQARFGALLRMPLERRGDRLRTGIHRYDAALVAAIRPAHNASAAERLAVYHRQYWFRLLTTLQRLFPLTARLLGFWRFNELAEAHVLEQPPRGFDIESIGSGFETFVAEQEPQVIGEAARIDAAFQRVLRAPSTAAFRPSQADAHRLTSSRLALSPAVALLEEHSRLCQARQALLELDANVGNVDDVSAFVHPEPHKTAAHFLLARVDERIALLPLEPREAELLSLLCELPLSSALAQLEARCSPEERAELPEKAQAWLARSVRLGVWAGFMTEV